MKYLRAFLEAGQDATDRTDKRPSDTLLSVLSVPEGTVPETDAPSNEATATPRTLVPAQNWAEAASPANSCSECGGAAGLSLVAVDGARACFDCLLGRTAMRARGVPL